MAGNDAPSPMESQPSRLMRLLQIIESANYPLGIKKSAAKQIGQMFIPPNDEEDAVLDILSKLVERGLANKSWDTRTASALAIEAVLGSLYKHAADSSQYSMTGKDDMDSQPSQEMLIALFKEIDIDALIRDYPELVASAGSEFEVDWKNISTKDRISMQKKNVKQSLGIMEGMGMDEFANELVKDEDLESDLALPLENKDQGSKSFSSNNSGTGAKRVKMETKDPSDTNGSILDAAVNSTENGLSARERQILRRKNKIAQQRTAHVRSSGPSTSSLQSMAADSEGETGRSYRPFPIYPWIWLAPILGRLQKFVFNRQWAIRHGSLLGISAVFRVFPFEIQAKAIFCRDILGLLGLDRFGDFVGDQVVAPVRETAAQTLAALVAPLEVLEGPNRSSNRPNGKSNSRHSKISLQSELDAVLAGQVVQVLLQLANHFNWQVRHAGLLGLKGVLRLIPTKALDRDSKYYDHLIPFFKDITMITATLLEKDEDEDVRGVSANLLAICLKLTLPSLDQQQLLGSLQLHPLAIGAKIFSILRKVDEAAPSVVPLFDLAINIFTCQDSNILSNVNDLDVATWPIILFPFMRHPFSIVRRQAIRLLRVLPWSKMQLKVIELGIRLVIQATLLEDDEMISQELSTLVLTGLLEAVEPSALIEIIARWMSLWIAMMTQSIDKPMDPRQFIFLRIGAISNSTVEPPSHELLFRPADLMLVPLEQRITCRVKMANLLCRIMERLNITCALTKAIEQVADLAKTSQDKTSHPSAFSFYLATLLVESDATTAIDSQLYTVKSNLEQLAKRVDGGWKEIEAIFVNVISELTVTHPHLLNDSKLLLREYLIKHDIKEIEKLLGQSLAQSLLIKDALVSIAVWNARVQVGLSMLKGEVERLTLTLLNHLKVEPIAALREQSATKLAAIEPTLTVIQVIGNSCGGYLIGQLEASSPTPCRHETQFEYLGAVAYIQALLQAKDCQGSKKFWEYPVIQKYISSPINNEEQSLLGFLVVCLREQVEYGRKITPPKELLQLIYNVGFLSKPEHSKLGALAFAYYTLLSPTPLEPIKDFCTRHLDTWSTWTLTDTKTTAKAQSASSMRMAVVNLVQELLTILSDKAIPYVPLFVAPIMGLMSDSDLKVRTNASACFSFLVRLVPIQEEPCSNGIFSGDDLGSDIESFKTRLDESKAFLAQLLGDQQRITEYTLPVAINVELRPYQQAGINWMAFLRKNRLHGILADDMGLGKTIQTLSILASDVWEQEQGINKRCGLPILPSLVICPASLVGHWVHEAKMYCPSISDGVICVAGYSAERRRAYQRILETDTANVESAKHDNIVKLVVMSYETMRNDFDLIKEKEWSYVVLDEGHYIKNTKTKLSLSVKALRSQYRLILSGTPIQNDVVELWALFDFLMPGFLGDESEFMSTFGRPILAIQPKMNCTGSSMGGKGSSSGGGGSGGSGNVGGESVGKTSRSKLASTDGQGGTDDNQFELAESRLAILHRQVLPFMLRRMKEDVLQDLPPKVIQDYYCELNPLQRLLIDRMVKGIEGESSTQGEDGINKDITALLAKEDWDEPLVNNKEKSSSTHIFQVLQRLRKICVHPALVLDSLPELDEEVMATLKKMGVTKGLHDLLVSPKLQLLKEILAECGIGKETDDNHLEEIMGTCDSNHRALIFAQQKGTLDLIENDLFKPMNKCEGGGEAANGNMSTNRISYLRLDGDVEARMRFDVVQQFNQDPSISVLLLTTHVGGLGLNLTSADTVIFVEHDWNPQRDLQAMDRAHRIGQQRTVMVYRLLVRDTLEERIMGLQQWKKRVAGTVVTQQNDGTQVQVTNLIDLLARDQKMTGKQECMVEKHNGMESREQRQIENTVGRTVVKEADDELDRHNEEYIDFE